MRIAVIGDVLLDRDVDGAATRLSPDAPVPVIDLDEPRRRAGGAGLVATMLARDGVDVRLVALLGEDAAADELRGTLAGVELVAGASGGPTPVKTRVRAEGMPIARLDEGCAETPEPHATAEMLAALEGADAIIAADYGRGLLSEPSVREALERLGRTVPLVWDPHPRGAQPVSSAAVVTPNLSEALGFTGVHGTGVTAATDAASVLRERWSVGAVLVTLGARGALLHAPGSSAAVLPAPRVSVDDPCGAGDRLASALAVGLARGTALADAAQAAVEAAAAFLARGGVNAAEEPEPVALPGEAADALRVVERVRAAGGTVVATGGCFDLLHAGHARTLAAARAMGDCLIVCLNSDASVRRLKGEERPIVHEGDRAELLRALECVDAVVVFEEDTPEEVLRRLEPDVWVKGGDYDVDALPEARLMASWGGRAVTVPYVPAHSTSLLAGALARVG